MNLDIDASLGLNGECNFLFSFNNVQDSQILFKK